MPFWGMPALALQLAPSGPCLLAERCPGPRGGPDRAWGPCEPLSPQYPALKVLGRRGLRSPDSLPFPDLPAGTDTMPAIEHVVVLVMENHSFDNVLGMLGRGDGFRLGA